MTELRSLNNQLAVIGFDAQLAGLNGIDRVAAALYDGAPQTQTQSDGDFVNDDTLCQRLLSACELSADKVAVVIVGIRAQVTVVESAYYRCDRVDDLSDALALSDRLIGNDNVAVLLVASNQQTVNQIQEKASISFDLGFNAYGATNGLCALLLASREFASVQHSYIYASINSAISGDTSQPFDAIINQAMTEAEISSEQISLLEVSACADKNLKTLEENGLLRAYQNDCRLNSAIGCSKAVFGENRALSELLGLLHCTLSLQQRYRPAINDWQSPIQLEKWQKSPFYLLANAVPLFPQSNGEPCYAAYSCVSQNHYSHLILQENNDQQIHHNGYLAQSDLSLFIIKGETQSELLSKLSDVLSQLDVLLGNARNKQFKKLAKDLYLASIKKPSSSYCTVLIAQSPEQLVKEVESAVTGVQRAFAQQSDWKTPRGSYFCVAPIADPNNIGFLYPGIGAGYLGLGRDLFHLFPDIYPSVMALSTDLGSTLKDKLLTPRSVVALQSKDLKQLDLILRKDLATMAECGVGYACVLTKIVEQVIHIKANVAGGYSMGEVSMFTALGCWKTPGVMSARLATSETFNKQLAGELQTIRALWNLPSTVEGGEMQIWQSYHVKSTLQAVKAVIADNKRVYITIINTAESLVIAGYPADCLAVIARLGVRVMPLNVANAIHCAPAYQHYQPMVDLYNIELATRIESKCYSSSCYLPVPFNQKAIAVSIAKCLCDPVDFPRLINALAKKASVFIEMGAGRVLSVWADKILNDSDLAGAHLCVAMNAKGSSDQYTFIRALAKLVSFGISADLHSFFNGTIIQPVNQSKLTAR
ncbi:PfaB family protein [Psychromonas antarctica]|uniref:PfaB family protein n=1 Tax=Psychromonas antarctica TaxID=67573 RepID=UPI001EE8E094|nr:PfaB family protein [Psychromonas antarctica]MCG6201215.1 PfaB family protein [Psychromonas antarctica]